ncbi:MAG: PfkB family carbohydrate kinase [archaeon]
MEEELIQELKKFKRKKILVVGDLLLDKFSFGKVERTNPEQPAAPLVKIIKEKYVLGGAANVANNLSSLGASCSLYGVIGRDFGGEKIKRLCKNKGIKFKSFYHNQPTILKQRIVAHGQHITRLDFGERKIKKINENIQEKIINLLKKEIKNFDFIILTDYDKFFFNENLARKILELAMENNIPTLVDPKPCNLHFFKNCTVICPNKKEAEEMAGIKDFNDEEETLIKMGEKLAENIQTKYIIITCGERGAFYYNKEGENMFIESQAREVSDVTGAGDTFAAVLSLGLASGLNITKAIRLANYASGVVVEKIGTAVPFVEEVIKKIKQNNKKEFSKKRIKKC